MAATTITRATLTDGVSDVTGDVWNAALVGTAIYDKVDALFAADVQWEKTVNSIFVLGIRNTNSGTAAVARVAIGNNTSALQSVIDQFSTGYTTSGAAIADSLRVLAGGAGGLTLATSSATGKVRVWPNNVDAFYWAPTGQPILQELSTNLSSSELTSGTQCGFYLRSDKFVLAYNDGGTVRYKYLDLTGTGVTWTHTTSAP